jgi:hypothetical protein
MPGCVSKDGHKQVLSQKFTSSQDEGLACRNAGLGRAFDLFVDDTK